MFIWTPAFGLLYSFICHSSFRSNEALINIPITPACTTWCKPLFSPTLSGCWSCCCWHICVCFAGVSLLVPHGAVAENMSWEMYMVINQGEARWGQSLPKYHFKHLSVCQSPSVLSSISPDSPSSVLAVLLLSNYLPPSVTSAAAFSHLTLNRTFTSQHLVVLRKQIIKFQV